MVTPLLLALALQAPTCLPPTPTELACQGDTAHRLACEVCILRAHVADGDRDLAATRADRDRRDAALAAQAGAWQAEVARVHRQSLAAWGLTVAGTAALAGGLVAIADGHRTAGALVGTGGAVLGTAGLVLARW